MDLVTWWGVQLPQTDYLLLKTEETEAQKGLHDFLNLW